jgi:hypothetical protein
MPDLTHDQLRALAMTRVLNREIIATLGRDMTDEERAIVDRARVLLRLKSRAHKDQGPKAAAERKREERQRATAIPRRACEDPKRRARLEKDPAKWLRWYMPTAYPLPFGDSHHAMIDGALQSARTGTGFAVAAPRGEGKTAILRGVVIYLVAHEECRFPVIAGWTHRSTSQAFAMWKRTLHQNERLCADYPELTQPFEECLHATRLRNMTWADTGAEIGADIMATERCIVLPDSRGAIAAASVQGDVKGLSIALPDGQILRPDLLLVDDAQDPKRAGNPTHINDVVDALEKQWMCLAGPQNRLTTMMACTVAAPGDVSERFLNRPDFRSLRVSRVTAWPDGWDKKQSRTRALWDEWREVWLDGIREHDDDGKRGLAFYRRNRAAMIAGMAVSWAQRYDRKRGDPDAYYSAMLDYYRLGEKAFASEYQNAPIIDESERGPYTLTPELICSRVTERPALALPTGSRIIVAATDLNPSYALSSALVSFDASQAAGVLWYDLYQGPGGNGIAAGTATAGERDRAVFEALVVVGKQIAANQVRPELWAIDASGTDFDTVLRFATNSVRLCGVQAVGVTGRGAKNYRPYGRNVVGKARENCHMAIDETKSPPRKWLAFHADYWREIAQRAWLGSLGAPGACSLFAGQHRIFAEQVCREQLRGVADVGGLRMWNWSTQPGPHDFGDCMTMCFALAAWHGIGSGGEQKRPQPRRRTGPRVTVIPI